MGCCGQGRAALRSAGSRLRLSAPASPPPPPATPGPDAEEVRLAYLANASIRVRGTVTRRTYAFSGASAVQSVHPHDADALLRTGLFRSA